MNNWLKILIPAAALLILASLFWIQRPIPVRVAIAETGTAVDAVAGTVKVLATMDVTVKSEHHGKVIEVPGYIGTAVDAGDVVARLNTARLENEKHQLQTRLEAARERAALPLPVTFDIQGRERSVAAIRARFEQNRAAEAELRNEERELEKLINYRELEQINLQEQEEIMRLQLEWLVRQIDEMHLRTPISGKVVEQFVFDGDFVHSGSSIVRIVTEDRFLELTLSEEDVAGVEPGQRVVSRLASFPHREFVGQVETLATTADSETKTRLITVSLDTDDEALVTGLTGEAYLVKEERTGNVLIPRRALIGREVYVVRNGRIAVVPVTPGFLSLNRAEILEGLEPGDMVITDGQSDLRAGDRVQPELRDRR